MLLKIAYHMGWRDGVFFAIEQVKEGVEKVNEVLDQYLEKNHKK